MGAGQLIPLKPGLLEDWEFQLRPPLVVTIAPFVTGKLVSLPTAMQVLAVAQLMLYRLKVVPEACGFQVVPPSVVLSTVPLAPVTKQVLAAGQLMPFRSG
jgi:hypothetical protein